MDWTTFFTIAGVYVSLMYWFREDEKRFEARIEKKSSEFETKMENRFERLLEKFDDNMNEFRANMNEFRNENKDFHGRLCNLEARYHSEHYVEKIQKPKKDKEK